MTNFDKIFEKSDISEDKKKSKTIFGKLLIKLRSTNHIKLYSLLGGVSDTDLVDNVLEIVFSDKTSYEMTNNKNDIECLNALVNEVENGVRVKLINNGKEPYDPYKFEQYLRDEFGKILTIK